MFQHQLQVMSDNGSFFFAVKEKRTNQPSRCELRTDKKETAPCPASSCASRAWGKLSETRFAQTVTGFNSPAAAMLGAAHKGRRKRRFQLLQGGFSRPPAVQVVFHFRYPDAAASGAVHPDGLPADAVTVFFGQHLAHERFRHIHQRIMLSNADLSKAFSRDVRVPGKASHDLVDFQV